MPLSDVTMTSVFSSSPIASSLAMALARWGIKPLDLDVVIKYVPANLRCVRQESRHVNIAQFFTLLQPDAFFKNTMRLMPSEPK